MTIYQQWIKYRIVFIVLFGFYILISLFSDRLDAVNEATVTGSVKLSLCGDGVVEGSEDCEPEYNEVFNCSDIGSYTGQTTCEISCSFDMLLCTPVVEPEPEEPPVDEGDGDDDQDGAGGTARPIFPAQPVELAQEFLRHLLLPSFLRIYDVNRDGILTSDEFLTLIPVWVGSWREYLIAEDVSESPIEKCDLNRDRKCDLFDFSILLYYSN